MLKVHLEILPKVNLNYKSIGLSVFFVSLLLLVQKNAYAQAEIKFYSKEKIKKEGTFKGVYADGKWTVPPKYNSIEGFDRLLICRRADKIDVYEMGYGQELVVEDLTQPQLTTFKLYYQSKKIPVIANKKWSNKIDTLNKSQRDFFKAFKSNQNKDYLLPYLKNGKWGFAGEFYNVTPTFDSLFVLCCIGSSDYPANYDCNDLVGVMLAGKKGVVKDDGNWVARPKDYSNITYEFQSKSKLTDYGFILACTRKDGIKEVYDPLSKAENPVIKTFGKDNLQGYIVGDQEVEPRYTSIYFRGYGEGRMVGTLPDGRVEVREGARHLSVEDIANTSGLSSIDLGNVSGPSGRYRKVESNPYNQEYLIFRLNGKQGLMNKNGLVILEPIYDYILVDMMNKHGVAAAKKGEWYSVVDSTGKEMLKGLTSVMNFFNGLAAVEKDGKWGYINTKAEWIISPEYEGYENFSDDVVALRKKLPGSSKILYGIVDKFGKTVVDFKYAKIDGFILDRGVFKESDTKLWGIMNSHGKVILPASFDSLYLETGANIIAQKGGKWGFIDKNGKILIPLKYDGFSTTRDENLAIVKIGTKVALMNIKTGSQLSQLFDEIQDFSSGRAMIELNKKKGFIDKTGKLVIPAIYDEARLFFDSGDTNFTKVKLNGKVIIIDNMGKKVQDTNLTTVYDR